MGYARKHPMILSLILPTTLFSIYHSFKYCYCSCVTIRSHPMRSERQPDHRNKNFKIDAPVFFKIPHRLVLGCIQPVALAYEYKIYFYVLYQDRVWDTSKTIVTTLQSVSTTIQQRSVSFFDAATTSITRLFYHLNYLYWIVLCSRCQI